MKLGQVLRRCGVRNFTAFGRHHAARTPFNILFFGTDTFALETLQALQLNRHAVGEECIVNKLDIVSTSTKSTVASFARSQDLKLLTWPLDLSDLDLYDLGVVVSFGKLVPGKVISRFPWGILNIHPSLLPRWRGASPIMHTVLNEDKETGVSVMSIQPKQFDTGAILQQKRLPVPEGSGAKCLGDMLAKEGAQMLLKTLQEMPQTLQTSRAQSSNGITYAHKATASMAVVDWKHHTSHQISVQYRALAHMFPLRTKWNEQTVKVSDMVTDIGQGFEPATKHNKGTSHSVYSTHHSGPRTMGDDSVEPGTVLYDDKLKAICIKCMKGWAAFGSITLRKKMSATDFHNGYLSKDKCKDVKFQSQDNGLFGSQYWDLVLHPKAKKKIVKLRKEN